MILTIKQLWFRKSEENLHQSSAVADINECKLNLEEYISSGIIESYVLGMATDEERAEFEKRCRQYPRLREARLAFEQSLEQKAMSESKTPADDLKAKIWSAIKSEDFEQVKAKVIPFSTPAKRLGKRTWWAVAASTVVLLTAGYFAYTNYTRNKELKNELVISEKLRENLEQRANRIEEKMMPGTVQPKQVSVVEMSERVPATITVYGDTTSTNVYLVITSLFPLPADSQYEIFSVTGKKYSSLGLFNAPDDNKLILRINDAQLADSFAIKKVKIKDK